jgi:regulator of protease activity HflC (stomatin/prohibitin superfamily)
MSLASLIGWGILLTIALPVVVRYSVAIVDGTEIAVLERRWIGRRLPPGRVVAMRGEVGVQAQVLAPGIHLLIPFIYRPQFHPLLRILEDGVGLVEAIDGHPLPSGQIFGRVVEGHGLFQDGEAFLTRGGQRGPQVDIVPPGLYRINPYLFRVTPVAATVIPVGKIGTVNASDGEPLAAGRLLARRVSSHDDFQNGAGFFAAGGEKGPQLDVLLPGRYRINTWLFEVQVRAASVISAGSVGIVTARDGAPLPATELVARITDGHREFQDAANFLEAGGQRGPQLGFLRPGTYYINPLMFDVTMDRVAQIERGEVAVIVSNVGRDPTLDTTVEGTPYAPLGIERYVVAPGYRGIQREVAGPGTYYLNKVAYTPHIIPTTNITIDWADNTGDAAGPTAFNPLAIVSKDGFEMTISVKVIIRVLPEQAPHMVARIGTIQTLITHVIHPLIDSSFRNQASSTEAMQFMQDRHQEQRKAEVHIARELERYHVMCVSVLICQIVLPERLMETLTNKVVATQQMSMFDAQRQAEDRRREMENTKAQADLQPVLVRAEVDVQIASQRKQEAILLAQGAGEATRLQQEGTAAGIVAVGRAEGERIAATGAAAAAAYSLQAAALGQGPVALLEVMQRVANGHVKITPDIVVSGGDSPGAQPGLGAGGLFAALVAKVLANEGTSVAPPP